MAECDALELKAKLEGGAGSITVDGQVFAITPSMVDIKKEMTKLTGRNFTPAVIEPSFGIGRIMYAMFEHSFYTRGGSAATADGAAAADSDARGVFRFTPLVAPIKATVFPLLQKAELNEVAARVSSSLTAAGLSNIVDTTGTTIGKRYSRTDEIGVPFAITVRRGEGKGEGAAAGGSGNPVPTRLGALCSQGREGASAEKVWLPPSPLPLLASYKLPPPPSTCPQIQTPSPSARPSSPSSSPSPLNCPPLPPPLTRTQVDYQVQTDSTVTLRERDSMAQVRVPVAEIALVVRSLVDGAVSWEEVAAKYPAQKGAESEAA